MSSWPFWKSNRVACARCSAHTASHKVRKSAAEYDANSKTKMSSISDVKKVLVVVGAGPGLSHATALRFAQHGFNMALLSRKAESAAKTISAVAALGAAQRAQHFACDATSESDVKAAFAAIKAEFGSTGDVLLNNCSASGPQSPPLLEMTLAQFEQPFRVACASAFLATREALPQMLAAGRGTILFTGATAGFRGSATSVAFPCAMSAVRMLAQSVSKAYSKSGIHVVHVRVDGVIDSEQIRKAWPTATDAQLVDPNAVADLYYFCHTQGNRGVCNEVDIRTTIENRTI